MPMLAAIISVLALPYLPPVIATGLVDATGSDAGGKKELVDGYSVYRKTLSWGDAQIFCEAHEGHLATFIELQKLKDVIEKIFSMSEPVTPDYLSGEKTAEFGMDRRYWIGLTDLVSGEGKWVWAGKGDALLYDMWYPGQPDHIDKQGNYVGRPEHCVALWNPIFHKGDRRHSMADQECKRKYYFICESDEKKIQQQKQWQTQNADRYDDKDPGMQGRSILGKKKKGGRGLGSVRSIQGRSILPPAKSSGARSSGEGSKGKGGSNWKGLVGFKDLFQASESTSVEVGGGEKRKAGTPREVDILDEEEVDDIFSKK